METLLKKDGQLRRVHTKDDGSIVVEEWKESGKGRRQQVHPAASYQGTQTEHFNELVAGFVRNGFAVCSGDEANVEVVSIVFDVQEDNFEEANQVFAALGIQPPSWKQSHPTELAGTHFVITPQGATRRVTANLEGVAHEVLLRHIVAAVCIYRPASIFINAKVEVVPDEFFKGMEGAFPNDLREVLYTFGFWRRPVDLTKEFKKPSSGYAMGF